MHLTDTIVTPKSRSVDVSTVQNSFVPIPETCLFWNGGNHVVERYPSVASAIKGHNSWCAQGEAIDRIIKSEEEDQ